MQDPTHTRFIVPRTFAYLNSQTGPDYHLDYAFRTLSIDLLADPQTSDLALNRLPGQEVERLMTRLFNVGRTIRVILERV